MAGKRAEQVTFGWSSDPGAEATAAPVPARPRESTPVARAPRPAAREPRFNTEERRLRWLTADEATAYLGFPTRKALYAAVERGQVPAHKLGRRLRFSRSELDGLLGRGR
jgi:excisionase family DNA binding protein